MLGNPIPVGVIFKDKSKEGERKFSRRGKFWEMGEDRLNKLSRAD